jgi:hypothetical protein
MRLVSGPTRRCFLQAGTLGLLRAAQVGARPATEPSFGRAKRCLLLFLTGGPPQHDTFDPKPDAPAEVRGELKPIATNVSGIHIGELFPQLARQAHLFRIVRSVTHSDTVHTSAGYTMLTGAPHPLANTSTAANIRPSVNDHPHFGSLLSLVRPPRAGTPPFVALPEVLKDAGVNEFPGQGAGFLGKIHDPIRIEAEADRNGFRLPDLGLPLQMTTRRLEDRRLLRERLDSLARQGDRPGFRDLDDVSRQAYELIRSPAVGRALELEREPEQLRQRYGSHLFGKGCLLGRRLLEAGIPMVTVYWHYEGPDNSPVWDTHQNNFMHLRQRLAPPADRAIAAVLEDLSLRGLLHDTLVIVMGEFGRSPRINKHAGRDHWPHVQSILLAGAGMRGGTVYGSSDRQGGRPTDNPVTPADLMASVLHLLGVPARLEVRDRGGRPLLACSGKPMKGLLE